MVAPCRIRSRLGGTHLYGDWHTRSGSYAQAPCAPRGGNRPDAVPFAVYLARLRG